MKQDIESSIVKIISEKLDIDTELIKLESTLIDLGADSLDTIEIMMEIESKYNIEFPESDEWFPGTVKDLVLKTKKLCV